MPYNPTFIPGENIPLPEPTSRVIATAYKSGQFIHHSRFSLLFNQERGFAACAAHNVDGNRILDAQQSSRRFKFDPKILPKSLQVDNDRGYRGESNPWDRGHLARRKSLSWGKPEDAAIAERESDHYSNICPQHENLHDDAWGKIEDWMLDRARNDGAKANIFTGPVFTDEDPEIVNRPGEDPVRIPAGFWKIIAVKVSGQLRAAAFLVWQRDYDNVEPLTFAPVLEQVRITTIEVLTGLRFASLRQFDPLLFGRDLDEVTSGLGEIVMPVNSPFRVGSPLELTSEALARLNGIQDRPRVGGNVFESADIVL